MAEEAQNRAEEEAERKRQDEEERIRREEEERIAAAEEEALPALHTGLPRAMVGPLRELYRALAVFDSELAEVSSRNLDGLAPDPDFDWRSNLWSR